MTLEFKKVIRGIFEGVTQNTENNPLSSETELKECGNKLHGETDDKPTLTERRHCYSAKSKEVSSNKLGAKFSDNLRSIPRQRTISGSGNNEQAPEWDKVFKNILGERTTECDTVPQRHALPSQEHIAVPQKHKIAAKARCPVKEASANPKNRDEEKVRELIALSRSFKLDDPSQHKINEYDGLGVNIFKSCDYKVLFPRKASQSLDNVKSMNTSNNYSTKPFEKYTHLTGFIAVKPYVKNSMENSDSMPVSEVWDDDFYF